MALHTSCFRNRQNPYTLLLISILLLLPSIAGGADRRQPKSLDNITVTSVIDGDTIKLSSGLTVRYIGLDTPERGEPLYREARERNRRLLEGGRLRLEICKGEERDRYGRLLALLYSDGKLINATILREGYAMLMVIAPCGLEKASILQASLREAIEESRGLWADLKTIPFSAAHHYIEKYMRVTGTVESIHDSGKAIYMRFSKGDRKGFYAVIFKNNLELFMAEGIEPARYVGRRVAIAGKVKEYRGRPEIIVASPYQVEFIKEQ
ncbi:MAG: thermonuclease family protein [Thermodesulfobacteriota bacterium]